jgi:catechol 2,3-dioxygenase-like lactoylglutathione lyase family enzyme
MRANIVTTDHFGFTKLVVGDLEAAADFYTSVCGLTELTRVDATIEGRPISEILFKATAEGAATFVLLTYKDQPACGAGDVILGFVTEDLDAFVSRVEAAGGKIAQRAERQPEHGVKVAFVRDPEDHLIEVIERIRP